MTAVWPKEIWTEQEIEKILHSVALHTDMI